VTSRMAGPGPASTGFAGPRPRRLDPSPAPSLAPSLPEAHALRSVLVALGFVLAWLVGSVLTIRRAHVLGSMRKAGISSPERTASRMYRSLGRGVAELVHLLLCRSASLRGAVRLDERDITNWLGGAQGAGIATAHTANWDLVACRLAEVLPVTVVTKHLSVRWLDRLWQGLRARQGVSLVGAGSVRRGALRALLGGHLVAMLVDQAPERRRAAIRVPFLGQLAWVDLAPALVAMRARVPLAVAFPRRSPDGSLGAELGPVLRPPAIPSRQWAEAAMRESTVALERFVYQHPEQWLWMHRRWKDA
jgi:Kdo2-lipid IVA lauroyltransferase/acyltransferase